MSSRHQWRRPPKFSTTSTFKVSSQWTSTNLFVQLLLCIRTTHRPDNLCSKCMKQEVRWTLSASVSFIRLFFATSNSSTLSRMSTQHKLVRENSNSMTTTKTIVFNLINSNLCFRTISTADCGWKL